MGRVALRSWAEKENPVGSGYGEQGQGTYYELAFRPQAVFSYLVSVFPLSEDNVSNWSRRANMQAHTPSCTRGRHNQGITVLWAWVLHTVLCDESLRKKTYCHSWIWNAFQSLPTYHNVDVFLWGPNYAWRMLSKCVGTRLPSLWAKFWPYCHPPMETVSLLCHLLQIFKELWKSSDQILRYRDAFVFPLLPALFLRLSFCLGLHVTRIFLHLFHAVSVYHRMEMQSFPFIHSFASQGFSYPRSAAVGKYYLDSFKRDHIHIRAITAYHYNWSILLLVTVINLFLSPIYKLKLS
jgi:hypothetical protein